MTIALLGDSFTLGIGVRDVHTLPAQLERHLSLEVVQVLNFGVTASNTSDQVGLLKDYVLEFEPDVVVLVMFLNDTDRNGTVNYWSRARLLVCCV